MKIVQLNAENIKRLVAVEIRPDGNLVEITGKNGQGKTSILDAIWWALDTNKTVQSKPVRDGAESGFIELDLGEYIVRKKFTPRENGDVTISLTVKNKDGAKFGSPQELLSGFIGDLTFDPIAFSRMKPRDQVTALRALVPGYDFEAADKANRDDFDQRTDINRRARELKAQIEGLSVPEGTPDERISSDDLMQELQSALEKNAQADAVVAKRANIAERISNMEETIAFKKQQVKDLQSQIVKAELDLEELRDEEDGLGEPAEKADIEAIRRRVTESEEINRRVDRKKQRAALEKELSEAEEMSASLTKTIEARKSAAAKAVREARLPVAGLELTEEAILLNGQPFNQASDAEQLRVSIAVAGAMNPRLRIVRVRDGSLLDNDSMAALTSYAEENDLQLWIETVQSNRETAIVIEDGRVRSTEEPAE
ncbi:AAA family ATPase [Agrobacterium tumefaciens]|uniref:AAA family ATPase n=1 Tax=Agrobacterium tumefaciens TaxID=358 RepID=UPI001572BFB4|nr:AAA family ATPase [Agrobacterium tumefaciens]NTD85444.1 AAA family ATPase [Agrobacterium tumefaciens]NTD90793.1 AAA family ATPase [Agrobacterium tumefaciens]NTD96410.1 AAA family ATPase [Agrobacterium tumefaciens]NTE15867.1 AAA family ATPase [Agrobacterium tumefaciens]NTE23144.1 AAA family ATPase [Agrobacterium tumefaciens]